MKLLVECYFHIQRSKVHYMGSSTPTAIVHIIKKDRFKMAAGVGLSTSLSDYFVRKECI